MRLSKNSTKVFATTSTTSTSLLAAAALAATAACIGIGCSDSKPATPKAAVESYVGPGTETDVNTSNKCLLKSEAWATIGNPDNTTLEDGTAQDGSQVAVNCEVIPDGDGFSVKATGAISNRKSFTVSGRFTPTGDQTVFASWYDPNTGSFQQGDCIAKYNHAPQGVAAGRVWAEVTCPHAVLQGTTERICQGTAEFRFENCEQ